MTDQTSRSAPESRVFKQEGKHRDGCWGHEAGGYCCEQGVVYRDKIGRRHPTATTRWFKFLCNDPDCGSVALVHWEAISGFVNTGIAAASPVPEEAQ